MNGVDTIYGVVGIPVTDLARHAQEVGIRYIGFRHEQSAGNAAAISGYLTRKPGICLTVSAPGFLNGLTPPKGQCFEASRELSRETLRIGKIRANDITYAFAKRSQEIEESAW